MSMIANKNILALINQRSRIWAWFNALQNILPAGEAFVFRANLTGLFSFKDQIMLGTKSSILQGYGSAKCDFCMLAAKSDQSETKFI